VAIYQGFVFATFSPEPESFSDYLGQAKGLIDQAVSMSPVGKIRLNSGWVKHRIDGNWKMMSENGTDGYHANHVHLSFLKVFANSQYDEFKRSEERRVGKARDWKGGHIALDVSERFNTPLHWLGVKENRFPEYTKAMVEAYGEQKGRELMRKGPPHAFIFPNLLLAEGNVAMIQAVAPHITVQLHTPMLLEGVPESLNTRIIRQSEAAMGPSAFLLADDSTICEQQYTALQGRSGWLELSRGLERERDNGGVTVGHISDETTNRGFWHHYLSVMQNRYSIVSQSMEHK
jgi:phenylpropionate dioxygenase-like ring-hydroxylating dioxygenase large terminal subunit